MNWQDGSRNGNFKGIGRKISPTFRLCRTVDGEYCQLGQTVDIIYNKAFSVWLWQQSKEDTPQTILTFSTPLNN